jgi:hypothetical protein
MDKSGKTIFWDRTGRLRNGAAWRISCQEITSDPSLQTGTSRRSEFVAKMFRLERRDELRGLLNVLFNIPPTTHSFTLSLQSRKGRLVLHESAIRNSAKYLHPTELRHINPEEIAQGICGTWEYLLTSDNGQPLAGVEPFLIPGQDAWMFWAGALVRRYYEFTKGGIVKKGAVR